MDPQNGPSQRGQHPRSDLSKQKPRSSHPANDLLKQQPRAGMKEDQSDSEEDSFGDDEAPVEEQIRPEDSREKRRQQKKDRKYGSIALEKGGEENNNALQVAARGGNSPPLHSWSDQKEQEEKMRKILQSYKDYDAASLDSEQFRADYDIEIQAPHQLPPGVRRGGNDIHGTGRQPLPYQPQKDPKHSRSRTLPA